MRLRTRPPVLTYLLTRLPFGFLLGPSGLLVPLLLLLFFFCCPPLVSGRLSGISGTRCPGPRRFVVTPPPSLFFQALLVSAFPLFSGPRCPGPRRFVAAPPPLLLLLFFFCASAVR